MAVIDVQRFAGTITGLGSSSGVRLVVGSWSDTPYGPFDDVMIEQADGHRVLLAPDEQSVEVITNLYRFDEVVTGPVQCAPTGEGFCVTGPELELTVGVGRRPALGMLLRTVPPRVATAPAWLRLIDPIARVAQPGVRTVGRSRDGRRVSYGVTDLSAITTLRGQWRGQDLGELADLRPPVHFGFGSAPRRPVQSRVVTTVRP